MDTNKNGKAILNKNGGEKTRVYDLDKFPAGMRVLIVDDDSTCLMILEKMLKICQYEVSTCRRANDALSMLREDKSRFDIVLSDMHMPDMDGLKLLEIVGLEMDLPVVMMSSNDGKDVVMRGIIHGACDYLVKPVRMDAIKFLWQHVIRKKRNGLKEIGQLVSVGDSVVQLKQHDDADNMSARNKENTKSSKRKKDDEDESEASEEASSERKRRFLWTQVLHQKFVIAVNQLGRDKAVPKKILELMQEMNVTGITRENIASHLQKYRMYLQRLCESPQEAEKSFMKSVFDQASLMEECNLQNLGGIRKSRFEQCSSLNGCNPQACATFTQPPLQYLTIPLAGKLERQKANSSLGIPLVDQRNHFDIKLPESSSYPITKPSKLAFPLSRTNSGESVFAKNICSGGFERLNENSSLVWPLVDITNHFDTQMLESSSYYVNDLSRLALPIQRTNSGEGVFGKIVSSGGLQRLYADSSLGSPLTDRTNLLDPKIPGSSSYPVNELSTSALPLWRTSFGEGVANKDVSSTGNTSSGEEYIYRNLGNIAQQSRNLSTDNGYDLKGDNMSDFVYESLLPFKNFDQGDTLRGPFT